MYSLSIHDDSSSEEADVLLNPSLLASTGLAVGDVVRLLAIKDSSNGDIKSSDTLDATRGYVFVIKDLPPGMTQHMNGVQVGHWHTKIAGSLLSLQASLGLHVRAGGQRFWLKSKIICWASKGIPIRMLVAQWC